MQGYDMFDELSNDGYDQRMHKAASRKAFAKALHLARRSFADFLDNAEDSGDFEDRLDAVKPGVEEICQAQDAIDQVEDVLDALRADYETGGDAGDPDDDYEDGDSVVDRDFEDDDDHRYSNTHVAADDDSDDDDDKDEWNGWKDGTPPWVDTETPEVSDDDDSDDDDDKSHDDKDSKKESARKQAVYVHHFDQKSGEWLGSTRAGESAGAVENAHNRFLQKNPDLDMNRVETVTNAGLSSAPHHYKTEDVSNYSRQANRTFVAGDDIDYDALELLDDWPLEPNVVDGNFDGDVNDLESDSDGSLGKSSRRELPVVSRRAKATPDFEWARTPDFEWEDESWARNEGLSPKQEADFDRELEDPDPRPKYDPGTHIYPNTPFNKPRSEWPKEPSQVAGPDGRTLVPYDRSVHGPARRSSRELPVVARTALPKA